MANELINIRTYTTSGDIDDSLSPTISIYNITTSTQEVTNDDVTFNATLGVYQYTFLDDYDDTNEYICDVFLGASKNPKNIWFPIGNKKSLTSAQTSAIENITGDKYLYEYNHGMSDIFIDRVTNAHNIKMETIGNITYVGKARIGISSADEKWSIQRYDKTSGLSSGWASGTANFDKSWDQKETYSYN